MKDRDGMEKEIKHALRKLCLQILFFRMLLEHAGWQNEGVIQETGAGWL